MESLVRLAVEPMAYLGTVVVTLGNGSRGGGELRKAVAMIAAGAAVLGFAAIYGFSGF